MKKWRQIPENIFHPMKNGGKFLKIFFTHEKFGGRFLKIFFTHEKIGGKFGTPKNPKIKSSQNQNPFCPNCRQDFFMPEKGVPAPFGALPGHFFHRSEKSKKMHKFCLFSLVGPWGPLLLSTLGGAIGTPPNKGFPRRGK